MKVLEVAGKYWVVISASLPEHQTRLIIGQIWEFVDGDSPPVWFHFVPKYLDDLPDWKLSEDGRGSEDDLWRYIKHEVFKLILWGCVPGTSQIAYRKIPVERAC